MRQVGQLPRIPCHVTEVLQMQLSVIQFTIKILVTVQLDAQIPFNIFISSSLHVSSMSWSSSGETDCIDTASGKCHSVIKWVI